MYQPNFGKNNQISFNNENEYYELLGYLSKSDNSTSITWEHNEEQGAWGSEGRIHFYTPQPTLRCSLNHTAGNGNIVSRVNCNEFIKNIVDNHGFVMGKIQSVNNIKPTIPPQFLADFDIGYNL